MSAQLVIVAGPDKGMVIPLSEGKPLQLGRGQQPDVGLNDLYVSRLHCHVVLRGGHLFVTDLGSAGGTYVNSEPVTERTLRIGEDLQIGETHFNLRMFGPSRLEQATIAPPMAEALEEVVALPALVEPDEDDDVEELEVVDELPDPEPEPKPPRPAPRTVRAPDRSTELVPNLSLDAPAPPKTKLVPSLPSERLTELTGERLAHYEVGKLLGRGKTGLVFRATDLIDDKPVALKVLWPDSTRDDAEIQRFIRSMKTAMTLRHPNIVSLYAAGKKGPYCYIAMEFVEGESLTELVRRLGIAGRVDWRHAFRINVHLARALVFAHEQQIIHRNLTPQNVMIRSADKMTLLGDLFLAKAIEGGLATNLTRAGEVLGDIRYMAPERLEGMSHVDHRSDIYSLGALIYTLLAGQPPFEGSTLLDLIAKVRNTKPEDVKKFQMGVPDSFNGVVQLMLAKRPENRYQETAKLLEDLEKLSTFIGVPV